MSKASYFPKLSYTNKYYNVLHRMNLADYDESQDRAGFPSYGN